MCGQGGEETEFPYLVLTLVRYGEGCGVTQGSMRHSSVEEINNCIMLPWYEGDIHNKMKLRRWR